MSDDELMNVNLHPLTEQVMCLVTVLDAQNHRPDDRHLFACLAGELEEVRSKIAPESFMVIIGVTANLLLRCIDRGDSFDDMLSELIH